MGHTNSLILAATLICLHGSGAWAQTSATTPQQTSTTAPQEDRLPVNIHGTIRSKYEYQTQENEGRFEVRNARVSVDGKLSPAIVYKAEIDLCDEGKIKMLDAMLQLKETLTFIEKHYPGRFEDSRYFAAVCKETLLNTAMAGRETGSIML